MLVCFCMQLVGISLVWIVLALWHHNGMMMHIGE